MATNTKLYKAAQIQLRNISKIIKFIFLDQIIVKILLLVFKVLVNLVPSYFHDGLHYRTYSRSLRSTSQKLM